MSAIIKQTIDEDADLATKIILASFDAPEFEVEKVVRRAYLLGRADQAAHNLDTLIKTCRSQAEERGQA